jgi:hypothetical protein
LQLNALTRGCLFLGETFLFFHQTQFEALCLFALLDPLDNDLSLSLTRLCDLPRGEFLGANLLLHL